MALDYTRLGTAIKAKIDALTAAQKKIDIFVWTAMAEAVVTEIQDNLTLQSGSLSSTGTGNLGAPVNSTNTNTGTFQ